MHWFAECVIEMGFPAQDQCKVIYGIIAVVHEHLDIVQDSGVQVLCFINCKEQGLAFFFVKIGDLLLDGLEHTGLTAFVGDPEDRTELLVKVSHANGGQAQIFHVEEAWIQAGSKTPQAKRLSHTRSGSKYSDYPDVFKIIQTVSHFGEVPGNKVVLFLQLLFVERIEGESVVGVVHQASPPALE